LTRLVSGEEWIRMILDQREVAKVRKGALPRAQADLGKDRHTL
jgi:hypothetical protein